jgi:hypothetical protein
MPASRWVFLLPQASETGMAPCPAAHRLCYNFLMVAILSIIGALINLVGQLQYIYYVINKKIILNKATWGVLAVITCLQAGTYIEIVRSGNLWLATTSVIVATSFTFIFLYSFIKSRYAKITPMDKLLFVASLLTLAIWQFTGDAVVAHIVLVVAIVISYMPTVSGLIRGTLREKPSPWFVGSVAYIFVVAAVLVESGLTNLPALMYPIVVGLVLNTFIGFLAVLQNTGLLKEPQQT